MAKQPKQTQTDYTRGGKAISDTAIPLYKENLTRMGTYLEDPMAYQNKYLTEYFTNTPTQNDFLRNYQRAMGDTTANNYAATTGGVASLNQRNYDDYQRYYNDQMARLYEQGVTSAYNMANQDYQNMLAGNTSYNQAYQLGKPYSDVEQYNYMVDQVNDNWWAPVVSSVGGAVSKIAPFTGPAAPFLLAGGAAAQGLGSAFTVDDSALRGMQGTANEYGMYQNMMNQASMGNAIGNLFGQAGEWLKGRNSQLNNNNTMSDTDVKRRQYYLNQYGF